MIDYYNTKLNSRNVREFNSLIFYLCLGKFDFQFFLINKKGLWVTRVGHIFRKKNKYIPTWKLKFLQLC